MRCGRYGVQQTLDVLPHSRQTEACLITALADQLLYAALVYSVNLTKILRSFQINKLISELMH